MEEYLFEFVLLVAVLAAPSSQLPPPPLINTPILPSTAIAPTVTATTGSSAQQQQTSQNVVQTLSSQLQQQPMTSHNKMTVSQSQVISTSSTTQYNLNTILFPNPIPIPFHTSLPGNIISNIVYDKLLYKLVLMCHAQHDPQWGFIWPNTPAGELAQIPCPPEFEG